jgi:hypothetical protein
VSILSGKVEGDIAGNTLNCAFPNSVVVDGVLDDDVWDNASWHLVGSHAGPITAPSDADASFAVAAVADDQSLYVAIRVFDDTIVTGESTDVDYWDDDAVVLHIDPNHGETPQYETSDGNMDMQIVIRANGIGQAVSDIDLFGIGTPQDAVIRAQTAGLQAQAVATHVGWDIEVILPLRIDGVWRIVPDDLDVIGFNVQMHDDDDGGSQDHHLIWSNKDTNGDSGTDTSVFGDLRFVKQVIGNTISVDAKGKLPVPWASLKASP